MKKLFALMFLCLVTACAGQFYQAPQNQVWESPYKEKCEMYATKQKRDQAWVAQCLAGNEGVMRDALVAELTSYTKDDLCREMATSYGKPALPLITEVATAKKLNCKSYITKLSKTIAPKLTADELCSAWYSRDYFESGLVVMDSEVKKRGINCVQVIDSQRQQQAAARQAEIMQQQAYAAAAQAQAAEAQARAARAAAIQGIINSSRPVTTNCSRFGYSVSCTSY